MGNTYRKFPNIMEIQASLPTREEVKKQLRGSWKKPKYDDHGRKIISFKDMFK